MHPALSVIFFTTVSGAGYGLLALLGLLAPFDPALAGRGFGMAALSLAALLAVAGLLASMLHLGRPERAWRAFSQWRTSWLSREGVASVATFLPAALLGFGWIVLETPGGVWAVFGIATAAASLVTVYCTAMIYRSLPTVQRWANSWVPPNYLALALMAGALWLDLVVVALGRMPFRFAALALVLVAIAAALKLLYWRFIDRTRGIATAESATGLGRFGKVRLFEAPHTEENYLLKEMGFRVARKHAARLRLVALALGFAAPFLLSVPLLVLDGPVLVPLALLAAVSATLGVFVERWLFFAEARHTVTLYYGASTA